ncbi:MAG: hypothetical protein LIP28_00335, partial [Deltaproteobacteria bacterium]|nr:hypothetical protein [Deltaproteobacteria bacterium]
LLSRRCPDLRKPEFHRIALEDGYTVVLGPLFETLLQPAPERLAAYASLIGREDAAALQVVLDTEIYWLEGWEALARTREKEDGPDAALAVMRKSFRFHQTPVVMEEILRLAEKTGERDAIAEFAERLASARETMRDRRFLQAKLDSTLRIAAALEDDALEHLAKAWRKQFGKKLLARPE